jgi:hypothetical protein
MSISLGPMPPAIRVVVSRLVAEAGQGPREADERLEGFFLTGGPTGCSYLDADGEVWNWCAWDESIERVQDGPLKVSLVAIAAERVPELADWLPHRPPSASDCHVCKKTGWLPPPYSHIQCPECFGMGWLSG